MSDTREVIDADGRWIVTTLDSGAESRLLVEPSQDYLDRQTQEAAAEGQREQERLAQKRALERAESASRSAVVAARAVAAPLLRDGSFPEADLLNVAMLFDEWVAGEAVAIGDLREYGAIVYEVVQAHTTQVGWEPPETPALWKAHRPAGEVTAWVQPTGGHDAYSIGERVTHPNAQDAGAVWIFESKIDANTTEPGTDGEFHRWWEPISAVV